MLAGSLCGGGDAALAQTPDAADAPQTVIVTGRALQPEGRDSLRATTSRIGKGEQDLRDIPQSVTVLTERLIDDRNLDTVKDALRATAGISFLAAEGGEEDVRLRGFSLQATGDVFVDGVRDPAFYERDTFNLDRLEVLRGSAGMLFGRGSTGGAVNQVSKAARLWDLNQVDLTLGSHGYRRIVGDFNVKTGDSSALRLGAMSTQARNNGSGSAIDKRGLALNFREGIGERDEFSLSLYHLDNRNGINYGLPWIRPSASAGAESTTVLPLSPTTAYDLASDVNLGSATYGSVTRTRRLDGGGQWRTTARVGSYTRDQRASAIRFAAATAQPGGSAATLASFGPDTVLTRGTNLKIQDMDTVHVQSDWSRSFAWGSVRHEVLAGVDIAQEDKTVWAARTAAQGGVDLVKPVTLVGMPGDGATVDEAARVLRVGSQYRALGWGAYAQDLIQVAPHWKLLAGLRYDRLSGVYDSYGTPPDATANGPQTTYRMRIGAWSQRAGVLFQPSDRHSFHLSAATSFNTSGDAYSLGASNVETPPEKSVNFELGGRIESQDRRFSTRFALFRSVKQNERNTDPLLPVVTLSGSRHVSGLEIDVAGRLTTDWEVWGSYTWMPDARVDKAAPCPATGACTQSAPGEREGDRPALTPRYSGSLWTSHQLGGGWRVGGGLNFRGRQTPTRAGFEVPSFVTADLMAEYTASDKLTWKANLSNVADRLYADQLYPGHYIPGAGRLLQVTASYRF